MDKRFKFLLVLFGIQGLILCVYIIALSIETNSGLLGMIGDLFAVFALQVSVYAFVKENTSEKK